MSTDEPHDDVQPENPGPYGPPATVQAPPAQPQWEQAPSAQPQYGQAPPAQPQWEQQAPQGAPPYGQAPPAAPQYGQQAPQSAPRYPQGPNQAYLSGAQPVLAHWGLRVAALLIDTVIAQAPYLVAYLVTLLIASGGSTSDGASVSALAITITSAVVLFVGWAATLSLTIWNRWIRQGRTGQSIGKGLLNIRLVSAATGQPIGAGMAFVRDLAHVADGFFFVGYLFPLWDPQKQTFADKMINTVVVAA
ncbi:RDD family protein [Pengzhenrongella sp.]|jgi:uncharacterized RDD family membrane protein YckC|uniref:RDD family protein n=1 Tax=Pengzhenrongella sp. TaxID=2888820 RepID=UPI002F932A89